jgi:hypothetical protein
MKALWVVGLLGLLLTVAYDKVGGTAGDAPQPPGGPVAREATVAIGDQGLSLARLSEYRLLHRALDHDIPLHAMTAASSCAE